MIDWDAKVLQPLEAAFGEDKERGLVAYTPASTGVAVDITGVFDNAYLFVGGVGDGIGASTIAPCLGVRLAQFAVTPRQGDTLIVRRLGNKYKVKEVQPDGLGWALLKLNLIGAA